MSNVKIEKSPGDLNQYHYFVLPNNLKVLLIQDNNTKQFGQVDQASNLAFCSVTVNAGSFNNPKSREGLAHFLEHMIDEFRRQCCTSLTFHTQALDQKLQRVQPPRALQHERQVAVGHDRDHLGHAFVEHLA